MLLDTDFLIGIIRKKPEVIEKLRKIIVMNEELYVTHINLCELYHGVYKSKNPEKNEKEIDELLDFLGILPFTVEIDKKFGELVAELYEKGKPIGQMDTLIAAFAIVYNQTVMTRNIKHFNRTKTKIVTF